ncbi:MAG TPA: septation protein A [Methylophilus sp.]|nr:septation protein A [Methylophilus sp.]HQQ33961.1 septation protein A [Methylophilus sp.]
MKVLFDLLPVILFFVGFKFYGIFAATAIAIATTLAMIVYSKLRHNQVDKMLLVNGAIISVLGGFTLLLHDKTYIMWKPTALYWLLAAVLLVSDLLFQKNLIRKMMESVLQPPESIWRKLNYAWALFFMVLGVVNLYVAFHYDEDTWVNFKLFGTTGLIFLFVIGQTVLLKNHLVDSEEAEK